MRESNRFEVKDDILYINSTLDGENVRQVLLKTLGDLVLKGLHADIAYPGTEKSLWLMKPRFCFGLVYIQRWQNLSKLVLVAFVPKPFKPLVKI